MSFEDFLRAVRLLLSQFCIGRAQYTEHNHSPLFQTDTEAMYCQNDKKKKQLLIMLLLNQLRFRTSI